MAPVFQISEFLNTPSFAGLDREAQVRTLAERLHSDMKSTGIRRRPYTEKVLAHFRSLPSNQQQELVECIKMYYLCLEEDGPRKRELAGQPNNGERGKAAISEDRPRC